MNTPDPNKPVRREESRAKRNAATDIAYSRLHSHHEANHDETEYWLHAIEGCHEVYVPMNFTKGLPHDPKTGTVSKIQHYEQFAKAIDTGNLRDFRETPLGHPDNHGHDPKHHSCKLTLKYGNCTKARLRKEGIERLRERLIAQAGKPASKIPQVEAIGKEVGVRAWESQSAGLSFDLEGPDAQAVTMPPAPALNEKDGTRQELLGEMAEVYAQALLRDLPFAELEKGSNNRLLTKVLAALNKLNHEHGAFAKRISKFKSGSGIGYVPAEAGDDLHPETVFRGITPGDLAGPYLSQFLLIGNPGINGSDSSFPASDGLVSYGAQQIPQKVRYALPGCDYMTTWEEWYSVQCAADVSRLELYADQTVSGTKCGAPSHRFITTPRDLSTYVHYDALYQAYLNACLYLLGAGVPFDPGIPFQGDDKLDHQQGFAHFGGPHILSLVTEVATRALKAVRFQKFNVHRRLRPEALAGRLEKANKIDIVGLSWMKGALEESGLLHLVRLHNARNNGKNVEKNILLPMAFTEGSPMHPTYGAGHATVAGACVTVLKAFFKGDETLAEAYHPVLTGKTGDSKLSPVKTTKLTVEGELNKLAANISIGRDFAGVHYYSDYVESIRMGEQIAIGILEEQKLMFHERFHMSFTSFDGYPVSI